MHTDARRDHSHCRECAIEVLVCRPACKKSPARLVPQQPNLQASDVSIL